MRLFLCSSQSDSFDLLLLTSGGGYSSFETDEVWALIFFFTQMAVDQIKYQ